MINRIETMPRKKFHHVIIRGIGKRDDFSRLICNGVDSLDESERNNLRTSLVKSGIVEAENCTDKELEEVCRMIMSRAVKLQ